MVNIMKHIRRIPAMRARNVEDIEVARTSRRSTILYHKRFDKYNTVQTLLERAMNDPQEIQKILHDVPILANDLSSGVFEFKWAAVYKMHFLVVTLGYDDQMHVLVQLNIIRHLLRFLEKCDGNVQIAGAKLLFKLINGFSDHATQVIHHGGAATIIGLLGSRHNEVKIEAMQAMACASSLPLQYRDGLIASGATTQLAALVVEPLLNDFYAADRALLLHNALLALTSLCSVIPPPAIQQMDILVQAVRRTIVSVNLNGLFYHICKDACFLFSTLAHFGAEQVFGYLDADLSQKLIWLMQNAFDHLIVEAVHRIVQTLTMSTQHIRVNVLMEHGLLEALNHNLTQVSAYRLITCRTIRCMIEKNMARMQQTLFDANLIHHLIQIIREQAEIEEIELKEEAIMVISRAIRRGTDAQIGMMFNLGCIELVCEYLNHFATQASCIHALKKIILVGNKYKVGDNANIYAMVVGHFGGDAIRNMRDNDLFGVVADWILRHI